MEKDDLVEYFRDQNSNIFEEISKIKIRILEDFKFLTEEINKYKGGKQKIN